VSVLQATNDYDVQVHWVYFENPLIHGSFDKSLPFALEQGNNVSLKLVFRPQNTQSVRSKLIISLLLLDKKNPDISMLRCFKVDIEAQVSMNITIKLNMNSLCRMSMILKIQLKLYSAEMRHIHKQLPLETHIAQ
jgi:hypothetical protein